MTVDLGSRVWGLETPAYGSGGVIKGDVVVKDELVSNAASLSVGVSVVIRISLIIDRQEVGHNHSSYREKAKKTMELKS
jgi:hypothetical protein